MIKDIKGFENIYTIDEYGVIRSKERYIEFDDCGRYGRNRVRHYLPQVIKPKLTKKGYHCVNLYDEQGRQHTYRVHVLVARAFLEPTDKNPDGTPIEGNIQVNHKDGNHINNHVSNLEYCDNRYNNAHAWRTGLRQLTDKQRENLRTGNPAKELYAIKNNVIIAKKSCSREMASYIIEELGAACGSVETAARMIRACCEGKKKTYKGFHFQYV